MRSPAQAYERVSNDYLRDQLILDHLEYVRHILGRITYQLPADVDVENLESAGVLGLVEAAGQFDPHRGVAFKTFAYSRIRGAILDELRRNCPLPQQVLRQVAKVRKACENLVPPVTPELIASETGLSADEVDACLQAMRITRFDTWDESMAPLSMIHKLDSRHAEIEAERAETREVLADAITRLPEQERLVVTLYYLEDLRLKEIGKVLKLSESRVSRILTKAEFRLKQYVRQRGG